MSDVWRVIDTGLRPPAQNIAINRAVLEARRAEEIPSTLRFLRCTRSVMLGYHQSAAQELNLDYCQATGIPVQRRITDGGVMYLDEIQLGWELYLHRRDIGAGDMQAVARRICHAAATAVSALGVDARYRPRSDIEVDGRKICSTASALDGTAMLYQGALQIDVDIEDLLRVVRVPMAASGAAVAAARERVAGLAGLLGQRPAPALIRRYLTEAFESEFDAEFHEGDLTLSEDRRYQAALAEINTPDWVNLAAQPPSDAPLCEAAQPYAGGVLRAGLVCDRVNRRIRQAWFTGDIAVNPRRTVADLEAALRDTSIERLEQTVHAFFASRALSMPALTPADFIAAARRALNLPLVIQNP